ncbi:hypothetical protein AB4Z14_18385 [Terrabacter sp. 2TAF16]|uniref:hypothetical protein n=1 Tax=Terrabacter sp. 2TAF16 TaxID=3233008 RepID=UPI003F990722
MAATSDDLPVSAAGLALGHRAFQEFLLAGERHVIGEFKRPGAERRFADMFATLPRTVRPNVEGYFRRQANLDLSQRAALLGPFVKLEISTPLNARTTRGLPGLNSAVRSELDSLSNRSHAVPARSFATIPSLVRTQLEDAKAARTHSQAPLKVAPKDPRVRHVDLVIEELTVENSNDDDWLHHATDTVHLAVTTISESGKVDSVLNRLGSRDEGTLVTFPNQAYPNPVLATIDLDTTSKKFPRTLSFKIDAVEKDDGTYDAVLREAEKYIQDIVTQELVERGIIVGGAWVGIPIPPAVAKFIASYVKSWFDDIVDWFFDIFDNDDDLIGSQTRLVTLANDAFEFRLFTFMGHDASLKGKAPLRGFPFTYIFSGSGGRWRVKFNIQLR